MIEAFTNLSSAKNFSTAKVGEIRGRLDNLGINSNCCIVTVGSYARQEASEQSDLDYFLITDDETTISEDTSKFKNIVKDLKISMPSVTGAFDAHVTRVEMLKNIGGNSDDTDKLTRRLLFLLESEWLWNEPLFNSLFNEFIETYVRDTITEHQLCRFLLNDLIRYYRTICVDFEYKTVETGKAWGDRNIKLMFSRKLIYFSGILVIAETVQNNAVTKRNILNKYLRMSPVARLVNICGARAHKALAMYDEFTGHMASPTVRSMLKATTIDRKSHSPEFRALKNTAHHFSWELSRLLAETYDKSHPIHHAIKF